MFFLLWWVYFIEKFLDFFIIRISNKNNIKTLDDIINVDALGVR